MNRQRVRFAGRGLPEGGRGAGRETSAAAGAAVMAEPPGAPGTAEGCLVGRVFARWRHLIAEACRYSSIPEAFLGALVAGESGGDPEAVRFEPGVYRRLQALAEGRCSAYAGLTRHALSRAVDKLRAAAALPCPAPPAAGAGPDATLRSLASSWGLTQIMGYHLAGRAGTVRDLLEPRFHLRLALELLGRFAERFQLDPRREFAELFRCWNTGQPYGQTSDPAYVEKGLRRMEIYRAMARFDDEAIEK
jgi:hypothetical protein